VAAAVKLGERVGVRAQLSLMLHLRAHTTIPTLPPSRRKGFEGTTEAELNVDPA
jgi:hypothetical protein